jgi:hypothetical protein
MHAGVTIFNGKLAQKFEALLICRQGCVVTDKSLSEGFKIVRLGKRGLPTPGAKP